MQSEPHVFRDMTEIDLAQAFPLAQATGVAATLDGWLAFTGDLLRAKNRKRTGLRALLNDRGTIVGLIMFAFTRDPGTGPCSRSPTSSPSIASPPRPSSKRA